MRFVIQNPHTGLSKKITIEEETKVRIFFGKKLREEVDISPLGPEFEGYVAKITGGTDKDGFSMKNGILVNNRVRLLMSAGDLGFQAWRAKREGERKRRSIRGCIVDIDISVLYLTIVKKGDKEIEGLTDVTTERQLPPKRASKIRRLFNLTKYDDVTKFAVTHKKTLKGHEVNVGPKIQRLVTPKRLRRKAQNYKLMQERRSKRKSELRRYVALLKAENKPVPKGLSLNINV